MINKLMCAAILGIVGLVIFGPISISISNANSGEVYIISCETPRGWEDIRTYQSPSESYHSRAGVWIIPLSDGSGKNFYANNCNAVD